MPETAVSAPIRFRGLVSACALIVAATGAVALLGWILGRPTLANLGSATIPVAPSTAVLFLAYAIALLLRARLPGQRGAGRAGVAINAAGALLALLFLVLSAQGIYLDIEHPGIEIVDVPGATPIGHMSPVTALCLLFAGASFLAERLALGSVANGLAGLVLAIGSVLALAYLYESPFFYGGAFIPPAAATSLAFISLGIALLALAAPASRPEQRLATANGRATAAALAIFAVLSAGILTAGFMTYRSYAGHYRTQIEAQLSAIAELKVSELAAWRAERTGDAAFFRDNAAFSPLVRRLLGPGGDPAAAAELGDWFNKMRKNHGYQRISFIDSEGRERVSVPAELGPGEAEPVDAAVRLQALASQRSGRVDWVDFHRDAPGDHIHLCIVAPVIDEHGSGRALGSVVLQIDPETYLYPLISRWPLPGVSAEAYLIRRDGNDALYLNPLRFRPDAALSLRKPFTQPEVAAVKAARGEEGIVEAVDYRNVPVVAALHAVPESPWFLVSRIDFAEVYAPVRERLWLTIIIVGLLLAGAGTGMSKLWQRQRRQALDELLDRERQLTAELEQRVAERTAELELLNKELEAFSYSVSHDLKAPLRGIDGYSQLLEEDYRDKLDDEGRTFLRNVRAGVAKMHELIEDLLAYSRMERRNLDASLLDLPTVVKAVVAEQAPAVAAHAVALRVEVPAVSVRADRDGLAIVLRNLLENAIKFSRSAQPPGIAPCIEIGARQEAGKVVVWVRDNGIGFDMKFHDRIFEMFSRLQRAEDFPGTGVGLALVRKAMQRMGGRVWAESSPGDGATFFLELAA